MPRIGLGVGIVVDKKTADTIQLNPPSGVNGASFSAGVAEATWTDAGLCPFGYSVVVRLASDNSIIGSTGPVAQDVGFASVTGLESWSGQQAYFQLVNIGNGGEPYLDSAQANSANFQIA